MADLSHTTPATVRQWQEAGLALAKSLATYLDVCSSLWIRSGQEGVKPQPLAICIDNTLQSLHTTLENQLSRSRAVLVYTKNMIFSPILRLPQEIISKIFVEVVYSSSKAIRDGPEWMGTTLATMFSNLHSLQRVCRSWRYVILDQGLLWSVVPICLDSSKSMKCTKSLALGIERARGNLHFAAIFNTESNPGFLSPLNWNISRFYSVNIQTKGDNSTALMTAALEKFLVPAHSTTLRELSLCDMISSDCDTVPSADEQALNSSHSQSWHSFLELLKQLSVFRAHLTNFPWSQLVFSSQLLELRLSRMAIGYDSTLAAFLMNLAAAPCLQVLQIISVSTFPDIIATTSSNTQMVTLPALRTLNVQNLFFNTLKVVLRTIAPGSHRLILCPSYNAMYIDLPELNTDVVSIEELSMLLKSVPIDTLLVDDQMQDDVPSPDLHVLLRSMPGLKTLHVYHWDLGAGEWPDMKRPRSASSESSGSEFPKLENLHLSSVHIHDEEGLKEVVTSHSIQRMTLGGDNCRRIGPRTFSPPDYFKVDEEIVCWLRSNVPDFRLTDPHMDPPEFESMMWRLW
ncbi:Protein asteroid homolog 1 [Pongo abelii] [Rhizoctonia solani]|uniref:Protein asteroid homolog 1 [Pongo abelii] n=1 Tax=Rhizoctonia solani TaxID=456999 RepID=A0A0K6GC93_9AGAM|nr:Protein asteroid homolog 1 [Pongo abelii] [Rhizoctonia solani]